MKKTLLAISSLCLCLCLTGCGAKTVNMDKAIHIECSGYNGYATASANIGDQEVLDLLTGAGLSAAQAQEIRDSMMLRTNKTDSLANNDKVTVTLSFDAELAKNYGVELVGTAKELTISGLKNPMPFEILPNIEVRAYRWSGEGEIIVVPLTDDPVWEDVTFYVPKLRTHRNASDFANGEVVSVFAEIDPETAAKHGKIINKLDFHYIVDQLPSEEEYRSRHPDFLSTRPTENYSYVVLKPSEIQ